MMQERAAQALGCLVIDGGMSGMAGLAGLSEYLAGRGVAVEDFDGMSGRAIHLALQRAYQRVRGQCGLSGIAAAGVGCDAALALAGQLPVDRIVLVDARGQMPPAPRDKRRELAGLCRYARRNAVFCVSDVLVIELDGAERGRGVLARARQLCNCRVSGVRLAGDLWTNRKEQIKMGIYRFLCDGVLPKSLAENSEMCIIYE